MSANWKSIALTVVLAALATGGAAFGLMFLAGLVSFGFWMWLGFGGSQPGPNKYGPNPKGE